MKKPKKKPTGHRLAGRICGYKYCVRCGLIALNNQVTRKAMRRCDADED